MKLPIWITILLGFLIKHGRHVNIFLLLRSPIILYRRIECLGVMPKTYLSVCASQFKLPGGHANGNSQFLLNPMQFQTGRLLLTSDNLVTVLFGTNCIEEVSIDRLGNESRLLQGKIPVVTDVEYQILGLFLLFRLPGNKMEVKYSLSVQIL